MNICIYTVHLFLYECITCKVKSCLSNYCTFHISYVATNTQNNYKITSWKKSLVLVSQAKDFHQHHIWCFPLPCTGKESPWMPHHPLHWSAVMSLHAAFMASNRDIWSCALWSYTFHLHSQKNCSDCAVGNLHIYAPKLDWLQWMVDSNYIEIRGHLPI